MFDRVREVVDITEFPLTPDEYVPEVGCDAAPSPAHDAFAFHPETAEMRTAHFLTYANANVLFSRNAASYCEAAERVGFASARLFTETELRATPFWKSNADTLTHPRGAGYWLWKPYVIRDVLRTLPSDGILVYSDAGRGLDSHVTYFDQFPERLLGLVRALRKGYLFGLSNNWLVQARFTKPDCFRLMQADVPEMQNAPQLQATWSIWRPTPEAFAFLDDWLQWCEDPRVLTDHVDDPEAAVPEDYQAHRHDQAVGSILAHRHRAHFLMLHRPDFKIPLNRIRQGLPTRSDFYKRIPHIEAFLADILDGAATRGEDLDQTLSGLIANFFEDAPIEDMSVARAAGYPHLRVRRYIKKVRDGQLDEIEWMDIWSAMRGDSKLAVKDIWRGGKRPAVEAARSDLLADHLADLSKLDTATYDHATAKVLLAKVVMRRVEELGIPVSSVLWSEFFTQLSATHRFQIRNLFSNLTVAEVKAFRMDAGTAFRERCEENSETDKPQAAKDVFCPMLAEKIAASDSDSQFSRWQALWEDFNPAFRKIWILLCKGKQMHVIRIYEEQMLEAFDRNSDRDAAFHDGCDAIQRLVL